MEREIAAFRLIAAAFLALGFTLGLALWGALLTAAPASAQDAQETPWYMPQPWVHPPQTGPKIRFRPGYYGHNLRHRTYGSFSTGCYGDCGIVRGTVMTGNGIVLARPAVAIFDGGYYYQIVPRTDYRAQQAVLAQRSTKPIQPKVVSVRSGGQSGQKPQPKFVVQNGVRIIRPAPVTAY